ncbi:alkaline phosphatase D family protein, partial [Nocardioides aquaticus]
AAGQRPTAAAPPTRRDPFTLGVASGDPDADGFVIWTRLAVRPLDDDGRGGMPSRRYPVDWEVATDRRFRRVVRRGTARVGPRTAHALHVELSGLEPGREYHYRFRLGRHVSPAGITRTAPAAGSRVASLAMAFASCANYPVGHFTAYRRLADEQPDLVVHLGDYQYEGAAAASAVRRPHVGPETVTLANYRQRLAQYKTDPDLQAAHAVAPWLVVWDDHEVDNNYAGLVPARAGETAGFARRRAAAYRAYYENMPLRRRSLPRGTDLRLFRRVGWGSLATFHLLDTRQYRSDQACGSGYQDCPAAADPARTLTGGEQAAWLDRGLRSSSARWDLLAQQVFFGARDSDPSAARTVATDAWDGYPASRDRVVSSWVDGGVRNPVVLTGDVHAHWVSDLYRDQADRSSGLVGTELVTSSITSGGDGYDSATGEHPWFAQNPNLRFWANLRGYVSTTITPDAVNARFRCLPSVTDRDAEAFTRAEWKVEDGVPGARRVSDSPLPAGSAARRRVPSDAEIVADTIEQETGVRP